VTLTPSIYSNVFVSLGQHRGTAEKRGEEIEANKNGVWCEVFSVENCKWKEHVDIFGITILNSEYSKYDFLCTGSVFSTYKLQSPIGAGNVMSGFCK